MPLVILLTVVDDAEVHGDIRVEWKPDDTRSQVRIPIEQPGEPKVAR